MSQIEQILKGDRLALARAISLVENESERGRHLLDRLFSRTGRAHIIGVTGPSGAGKSTLVNGLVKSWLSLHPSAKIGVIAVDPTSPFTGGALLGDRLRMKDIAGDDRVFIRSMATRGALGGLSRTVPAVIQVMDAASLDPIIVETVGAGQAEVEIARVAHTTLVVEAPGLGDDVQAIKAGILEIADILVVNKADRLGEDLVVQSLRAMLELGFQKPTADSRGEISQVWIPPIVKTIATEGNGISELVDQIQEHAAFIRGNGSWRKKDRRRLESWLESLYAEKKQVQWEKVVRTKTYAGLLTSLLARRLSPYQVIDQIIGKKSKNPS
jgi:LAO/AO transport system kinase